jgi:hypothetical protein
MCEEDSVSLAKQGLLVMLYVALKMVFARVVLISEGMLKV